MKVTAIGATGRIGKRVARMLVEHGHDVRGVNRDEIEHPRHSHVFVTLGW